MFLEILAIGTLQFAVDIDKILERHHFLVWITELNLEVEMYNCFSLAIDYSTGSSKLSSKGRSLKFYPIFFTLLIIL